MTLGAIIMLGAGAGSSAEALVLEAQRAATIDLVNLIQAHINARIILSSPQLDWFPRDIDAVRVVDAPHQPFHFGAVLADLIESQALDGVLYFGGGSAPLLDGRVMEVITGLLAHAGGRIPTHIALANNRHSSDWVTISQAQDALPIIRAAHRDNSLAWALGESGTYEVRIPAGIRPATSMDIDTPTDLAILRLHPDCPPHLRSALDKPELDAIPLRQVIDTFRREGAQTALIGRVSPLAWGALNKVTRCWIRVYAEERGMVAAERVERGAVRSLLGELLRSKGMAGFFDTLGSMAEAAIIDSRVLMADTRATLPPTADRFASDLFMVDAIQDPWLKEFTHAAQEAPLPIVLGGHGVVAGGLYALAEIIERGV